MALTLPLRRGNRFLDRITLVGTFAARAAQFFNTL